MRLMRFFVFALGALAPLLGYAQSVPAGTITLLNGQAQVTGTAAPVHALNKGDSVYAGDIVETGAGSYALIRFSDQSSVLLRPRSRFQIEQYQYAAAAPAQAGAPAPAQRDALAPLQASAGSSGDSSFFRLLKGGLRAVSGLIAHADYSRYRMSSPVATMGIRGTDYELALCEDACLSDPTVLNALPPGKTPAGGVVSGVNEGQIVATSYTGNSLTLGPGQYAITLADGSQYLLNGIPAFLKDSSAAAGGTAAGGAAAASSAASGSVLTATVLGVGIAAIIGVVVSSSSDNGSSSTTATTATQPTGGR